MSRESKSSAIANDFHCCAFWKLPTQNQRGGEALSGAHGSEAPKALKPEQDKKASLASHLTPDSTCYFSWLSPWHKRLRRCFYDSLLLTWVSSFYSTSHATTLFHEE